MLQTQKKSSVHFGVEIVILNKMQNECEKKASQKIVSHAL